MYKFIWFRLARVFYWSNRFRKCTLESEWAIWCIINGLSKPGDRWKTFKDFPEIYWRAFYGQ